MSPVRRIKMGPADKLAEGKSYDKQILARRYAVFRYKDELFGIEAECKHLRATLANGEIEDGQLVCKWHGWRYDLASGKCLTHDQFVLKRFEVEVSEGDIYLILK